jgi:hypothetical protein
VSSRAHALSASVRPSSNPIGNRREFIELSSLVLRYTRSGSVPQCALPQLVDGIRSVVTTS